MRWHEAVQSDVLYRNIFSFKTFEKVNFQFFYRIYCSRPFPLPNSFYCLQMTSVLCFLSTLVDVVICFKIIGIRNMIPFLQLVLCHHSWNEKKLLCDTKNSGSSRTLFVLSKNVVTKLLLTMRHNNVLLVLYFLLKRTEKFIGTWTE